MDRPVFAAFFSVLGTSLTDNEKRWLEKYNPLGITLFDRNFKSKNQARKLIASIKQAVGHDRILIAIDQEGGRVNRLKAAGFSNYASQRTLGQINDSEITAYHAELIARDMHDIGVNMNFAPVLDIDYPETTITLKGRCFGSDPKQIVKHGKILIDTYKNIGICPCMKHLPAHGRAQIDPHLGLPCVAQKIDQLADDFYPFRQLNDCPAAMTAHILIPEIDSENPITLSAKGIRELIRGRIGFDGLLISDALDMHALKGSVSQKAAQAWIAGCDVVCYCMGRTEDVLAICEHQKYLSDTASDRINAIWKILLCKKKIINVDHMESRYYNMISQFSDNDINYDATEVLHQMQKGEK